jgi:predicted alternative tryptophan synthase beta-subunit
MVPPAQVMEVFAEPDCKMVAKHLCDYSGHGLLDLAAYDDYLHGRLDLG